MMEPATIFSLMANHLWQSAVLAGVLAVLLTAKGWLSAQARCTLAFATLIAAAVLPLAMLLPGNEALMRLVSSRAEGELPLRIEPVEGPAVALPADVVAPAAPSDGRTLRVDLGDGGWRAYAATSAGADVFIAPPRPDESATAQPPAAAAARPTFDLHRRPAVIWSLIAIWLVGAATLLVRTGADVLAAERLRRRAHPLALPRPIAHLVGEIDVRESAQAPGPMAAGLIEASIILPPGFISSRSAQELLGLLEHERAHVARGDLRIALVQRILTALLWWSPAIHWISARVEEEREMACDEAAATRVGDARAFAKTLTEHAQAQLFWGWPKLVVGAARRRSQLGRRVRRLLEIAGGAQRPLGAVARGCAAVLLAAVAATAIATPRLAAQDSDDDRDAPAAAEAPRAPRAPRAPEAEAAQAAAEEELEAAREEFDRVQGRFNEAVNAAAESRAEGRRDRRREQELAEARRELQAAARALGRASAASARSAWAWAPGVQVNVHGLPNAQEIEQAAEAWADAMDGMSDDFDFDFDFDFDSETGQNMAYVDLQGVQELPGFGVSAAVGWGGRSDSPLLAAVRSGDLDMVEVLVDAGADVNAQGAGGAPLMAAVQSGARDMVEYLLDNGADPNLSIRGQGTPLMTAIRMGDRDMVRLLADGGARIDAGSSYGETALMAAVRSGDVDLVRLLIELGADVEGGSQDSNEEEG